MYARCENGTYHSMVHMLGVVSKNALLWRRLYEEVAVRSKLWIDVVCFYTDTNEIRYIW